MLRFDNQVAVVTGAGGGLGRSHALLLASRGARVVVNDLGTGIDGTAEDSSPAKAVAEEITAAEGTAVANHDSVVDGEKIIEQALDTFGRVDIVINNAGFLRDISFHKMHLNDWQDLYNVHLLGAFKVTHAAWPHMREQEFGRVINTGSAAGIYGNFGQTNYAAFKLALHGFTQALAIEGASKNIHVNTIAPAAASRLTETVMSAEMLKPMRPELVSPLVAFLCHRDSSETGSLFEIGGGWIGKLRWERTRGVWIGDSEGFSPEDVAANWSGITDFSQATHPGNMQEAFAPFSQVMSGNAQ